MKPGPTIVDRQTWLKERKALLAEEKALTRSLDALAVRRRSLPWVQIEKDYIFETSGGQQTLSELFDGRSQLAIYHFMMGPDWPEGCAGCSFWADSFNGTQTHLANRDTSFVAASRAPLAAIDNYKKRMGWNFNWVSSLGSDFNMDFGVSFPEGHDQDAVYNFSPVDQPSEESEGLSVLAIDAEGQIFHTYSTFARGVDIFNAAYQILDLTPKGRDEDDLEFSTSWLRRHDDYET